MSKQLALAPGERGMTTAEYALGTIAVVAVLAVVIGILTGALDVLGIAWRRPRRNLVAVSRREAVAALDGAPGQCTGHRRPVGPRSCECGQLAARGC